MEVGGREALGGEGGGGRGVALAAEWSERWKVHTGDARTYWVQMGGRSLGQEIAAGSIRSGAPRRVGRPGSWHRSPANWVFNRLR